MMGKPIRTADLSSCELMDAGPTVREPAWDQSRSSANHVALSLSKTFNSESRTSPCSLAGF